jgi:hypothetical protein
MADVDIAPNFGLELKVSERMRPFHAVIRLTCAT